MKEKKITCMIASMLLLGTLQVYSQEAQHAFISGGSGVGRGGSDPAFGEAKNLAEEILGTLAEASRENHRSVKIQKVLASLPQSLDLAELSDISMSLAGESVDRFLYLDRAGKVVMTEVPLSKAEIQRGRLRPVEAINGWSDDGKPLLLLSRKTWEKSSTSRAWKELLMIHEVLGLKAAQDEKNGIQDSVHDEGMTFRVSGQIAMAYKDIKTHMGLTPVTPPDAQKNYRVRSDSSSAFLYSLLPDGVKPRASKAMADLETGLKEVTDRFAEESDAIASNFEDLGANVVSKFEMIGELIISNYELGLAYVEAVDELMELFEKDPRAVIPDELFGRLQALGQAYYERQEEIDRMIYPEEKMSQKAESKEGKEKVQ